MGGLGAVLAQRIGESGPLSVAEFMAQALGHPEHGYYTTREPFGTGGDFTTAPEISQMFGELIGLWCALTWQAMGAPERVVLAELGPGRGTLMSDLLRAAAMVPPFLQAAEVWLVETSPRLQARQRQTLAGREVRWCERFDALPDGPILVVANELFDALPVRQFVKRDGEWFQRMVGLENGAFAFILGAAERPDLPDGLLDEAPDGAIAETSPQARELAKLVGKRLNRTPGAALIVDYGHARCAVGDTLQAVRSHKFHPVLDQPGSADITAHVDFQSLAAAAIPARAWGPMTQGDFLRLMGIETRAAMLAANATPKVAADIAGQLKRLIDPAEMGAMFKVLGLAGPTMAAPPGFVA